MDYIKLLKYPGSKTSLLPDIKEVFTASGKKTFVDVFGGSALVSLNIHALETVYNDINEEIVCILKMLRDAPKEIIDFLDIFKKTLETVYSPAGSMEYNEVFRNKWLKILEKTEDQYAPGGRRNEVSRAVRSLIQHNLSFGGMGDTYGTIREKSPYRVFLKMSDNIARASRVLRGWKIENMDYRKLIEKYDSRDVFFYLDPPYPGKEWYVDNFDSKDFATLRAAIDSMAGSYLLNLDLADEGLREIFGAPDYVRTYPNRNGPSSRVSSSPRRKMFYTNVSTESRK